MRTHEIAVHRDVSNAVLHVKTRAQERALSRALRTGEDIDIPQLSDNSVNTNRLRPYREPVAYALPLEAYVLPGNLHLRSSQVASMIPEPIEKHGAI